MEKAKEVSVGICQWCLKEIIHAYVFDMGTPKNPRKFHLGCYIASLNQRRHK